VNVPADSNFGFYQLSPESSVKGENCLEIFSRYSDRKVYEASVELHLMTKLFSVQSLHSEGATLIESKTDML